MGKGIVGFLIDTITGGQDAYGQAEVILNQAGLVVAQKQVEAAVNSWAADKSDGNAKAVRNIITAVQTYLGQFKFPDNKAPEDMDELEEQLTQSIQAKLANMILMDIAMKELSDQLPPNPTPWSTRRASFERQMKNFTIMAIQFERVATNAAKEEREAIQRKQDLVAVSKDPNFTPDQQPMLNEDIREAEADEQSWKRTKVRFSAMAAWTKERIANFKNLIAAGDQVQKAKH